MEQNVAHPNPTAGAIVAPPAVVALPPQQMAPRLLQPLPSAVAALLAAALLTFEPAQAQPAVSAVSPGAVQPGKTVQLQLRGANLTEPLKLWTSFPAVVESLTASKDGKTATAKLRVAPEVTPQVGGLLIGGKGGVSNPTTLMVDDLTSTPEVAGNQQRAAAQKVKLPIAVDGVSNGIHFDYFCFPARKGQRVSLEVYAHRIGSMFDPVVRVLDAQGNELAMVDDTPGLNGDCQLSVSIPADGDYYIQLHDNQYRSGGRYRLRLGSFPVHALPLPLGIRRGATTRVSLADQQQIVTAERGGSRIPVAWSAADGGSAILECLASDLPELVEAEPNDDFSAASTLTLPSGFSGLLDKPNDRDWIRFLARKGRVVHLESSSAKVGSPGFVMLRVVDAAGKTLAASQVGGSHESTLKFTPPADGEYGVEVRDLLNRGGPRSAYRVELRDGPDFRLRIKADKAAVTRFVTGDKFGGVSLTVQCERRGYDGPITLSLDDHADDFELLHQVIPAKASEIRLVIVPKRAIVGDVHILRLLGRATIEGGTVTRRVSTTSLLRVKQPAFPFPEPWRDGLIGLAIQQNAKPFFTFAAPATVTLSPTAEQKLDVPLKRDAKDYKGQVRVVSEPGVAGLAVSVQQAKGKYTLSVKTTGLAEGTYPVTLRAIGEHKGRTHVRTSLLNVQVASQVTGATKPKAN